MNRLVLYKYTKGISPYFLLVCVLFSLFYRNFSPPECTKKVFGPFGSSVIFNCDSAQFMQDSRDLKRILEGTTSYQDRPLYAVLSKFISYVFEPLIDEKRSFRNSEGILIDFYFSNLLSFYLINLSVLLLSLYLFSDALRRILNPNVPSYFAFISLVFLNDIVKGFTWTPHTQVFNILLITFALYSWARFRTNADTPNVILWFVTVTVLAFFYPSLLLLVLIPLAHAFKTYFFYSLIPIFTFISYPFFIHFMNGSYRNAAVQDFNQFVWILNVRSVNDVSSKLGTFFVELDKTLILMVFLLSLMRLVFRNSNSLNPINRTIWVFVCVYAVFLMSMGFYSTRLSTPLLLIIIIISLIELNFKMPRSLFNLVLALTSSFLAIEFFLFQGQLT
jgi:hypothetical protein